MSSMSHLFNSTARAWRMVATYEDGAATGGWTAVSGLTNFRCRFDLMFIRPGRDEPALALEAGKIPDRVGVMFCDPIELKAGDQIQALSGPVVGIFEVRAVPDIAVGFNKAHHLELSVREVAQDVAVSYLPAE